MYLNTKIQVGKTLQVTRYTSLKIQAFTSLIHKSFFRRLSGVLRAVLCLLYILYTPNEKALYSAFSALFQGLYFQGKIRQK